MNFNGRRMRLCNIEFDESQKMTKTIYWRLNEPNGLEFDKEIGKNLKTKQKKGVKYAQIFTLETPWKKSATSRTRVIWPSRSRTSFFHTQTMMYLQCWLTLPGHVSTQYPQKPFQWIHQKSFCLCNKSSLEVVEKMGWKIMISAKRHWWVGKKYYKAKSGLPEVKKAFITTAGFHSN